MQETKGHEEGKPDIPIFKPFEGDLDDLHQLCLNFVKFPSIEKLQTILKKIQYDVDIECCNTLINILFKKVFAFGYYGPKMSLGKFLGWKMNDNIHNTGDYKCIFHKESLIVHSLLSFAITWHSSNSIEASITAFFHDIGKITCNVAFQNKTGIKLKAFKGHGPVGANLFGLWKDIFVDIFNEDIFNHMQQTISLHMCSIMKPNCDDIENSSLSIALAHPVVREYLLALSYGDLYGCVRDNNKIFEPENQKKFIIMRNKINNIYYDDIIKNSLKEYHTIVFTLIGHARSGKTTTALRLKKLFEEEYKRDCIIVSRDDIIKHVVNEMAKGKELKYNEIYKIYKSSKFYPQAVDKTMKKLIHDSIVKGFIVIIDTVKSMYRGAESIYPYTINCCFRINLFHMRTWELTEKMARERGMSLEELKFSNIAGPNDPFVPWKNVMYYSLISKYESGEHSLRPHLCFPITGTEDNTALKYTLDKALPALSLTMKDIDIGSSNMNLYELLCELQKRKIEMKDWFEEHGHKFMPLPHVNYSTEYKIFKIMYNQGYIKMNEPWMREGRGTIIAITKNGNICVLKQMLNRGSELRGKAHTTITETESCSKTYDNLDKNQRKLANALVAPEDSKDIQIIMSSKVDGSLVCFSIYKNNTIQGKIMRDIITKMTDERQYYHKELLKLCDKFGLSYFIVISSSGSLLMDTFMMDHTVTSILTTWMACSYDMLMAKKDSTKMMFDSCADTIVRKISQFYDSLPIKAKESNVMCLSFEAFCKNRTSVNSFCKYKNGISCYNCKSGNKCDKVINNGTEHIELAVRYPICGIPFLGLTAIFNLGEKYHYRAHSQMEDFCAKCDINTPAYWIVTPLIANTMLNDLDDYINGKLTMDIFLEKHKPSGKFDISTFRLDVEGWILLMILNTGHDALGFNSYDLNYDKFKTKLYYLAHKYHGTKIQIDTLSNCVLRGVFPLVDAVHDFYNISQDKLVKFINDCRNELTKMVTNEDVINELKPKARESCKNGDMQRQFRIITGNSQTALTILSKVLYTHFPTATDIQNANKLIQMFIFAYGPWNNLWIEDDDEKIKTHIDSCYKTADNARRELFTAVLKHLNVTIM